MAYQKMLEGSLAFLGATLLSSLWIRLLRGRVAHGLGLIDHPGVRKQHDGRIPTVGGLAILLTLFIALPTFAVQAAGQSALLAAMALLGFLGVLDDRRAVRLGIKFVMQFLAAALVVFYGRLWLSDLGDLLGPGGLALGLVAIPFTLFAIVGLVNATNMVDGMDGLAGGLVAVALFGFLVLAAAAGRGDEARLIVLALGALSGFLVFNMRHPWNRRASVFLGDTGSLSLGLLVAWLAISLSQGEQRALSPAIALWLFALPLMDCISIILRRLSKGRNPFHADRQHLHHVLLLAGYSPAKTVAIILALAIGLAALGVLGYFSKVPEAIMFWAFIGLFGLYHYAVKHAWRFMKVVHRMHDAAGQQPHE